MKLLQASRVLSHDIIVKTSVVVGAGKSLQAELFAQFCRLSAAKKLQLFGINILSYTHRTIHLSLISVSNPGVSEAGNVLIFICYVY